jgi:AbrB family looped-hinge helix DNA binding protein
MKVRVRVGKRGQVVIPKEIREKTGVKEGVEVVVEVKGDVVTISRARPPTEDYVSYYRLTYSKKLNHDVDIRGLLEEERAERHKRVR